MVNWNESMKKKSIFVVTIFILIVIIFITIRDSFINTIANRAEEESQDILYQDVIITALVPTIDLAVADYYKDIFSETPFYDLSYIKILNIERPNGYRTSYFIINIEVTPFFGPHITVGRDRLSIELSYPGIQNILKFEHLEDYPLPERYKHLYLT